MYTNCFYLTYRLHLDDVEDCLKKDKERSAKQKHKEGSRLEHMPELIIATYSQERKGEMLEIFTISVALGFIMLGFKEVLINISGWILILLSFTLMLNPVELYKKKAVSSGFVGAFFVAWFFVVNFGTHFFINLITKVESLNGFTSENIRTLFLGVVFIVLLILSIWLFIYKLFQTAGLIEEVNLKLEEKNPNTYGPGNDG